MRFTLSVLLLLLISTSAPRVWGNTEIVDLIPGEVLTLTKFSSEIEMVIDGGLTEPRP